MGAPALKKQEGFPFPHLPLLKGKIHLELRENADYIPLAQAILTIGQVCESNANVGVAELAAGAWGVLCKEGYGEVSAGGNGGRFEALCANAAFQRPKAIAHAVHLSQAVRKILLQPQASQTSQLARLRSSQRIHRSTRRKVGSSAAVILCVDATELLAANKGRKVKLGQGSERSLACSAGATPGKGQARRSGEKALLVEHLSRKQVKVRLVAHSGLPPPKVQKRRKLPHSCLCASGAQNGKEAGGLPPPTSRRRCTALYCLKKKQGEVPALREGHKRHALTHGEVQLTAQGVHEQVHLI